MGRVKKAHNYNFFSRPLGGQPGAGHRAQEAAPPATPLAPPMLHRRQSIFAPLLCHTEGGRTSYRSQSKTAPTDFDIQPNSLVCRFMVSTP